MAHLLRTPHKFSPASSPRVIRRHRCSNVDRGASNVDRSASNVDRPASGAFHRTGLTSTLYIAAFAAMQQRATFHERGGFFCVSGVQPSRDSYIYCLSGAFCWKRDELCRRTCVDSLEHPQQHARRIWLGTMNEGLSLDRGCCVCAGAFLWRYRTSCGCAAPLAGTLDPSG